MKKSKVFAIIVYFIFTFGIGIVFSMTLPGYFATFTVPSQVVKSALRDEDFITGIVLTEPVGFYRHPVLDCKFEEGGGVVLYETVMEVYDRKSAEAGETSVNGLTHGMLYKCYEGYVYGVEDRYDVFSKTDNKTSLRVTAADGTEKVLPLLDYDSNGDGNNDGISSFEQNGFVLLEIREGDVPSVKSLAFTDRSGNTVFTAAAGQALTFQSVFFDCFGDIAAYNQLVADGNRANISDEELNALLGRRNDYVQEVKEKLGATADCAVTASSEEYAAAAKAIRNRANKKATPFIIVYFVVIYIIADFLLGSHLIIKFFQWFLFKVCKIPHKAKKAPKKEEVFGHDYFCMVTLKLDVSEIPEFNGSVEIKYSRDGEEAVFTLLKADGYSAALRLKAGLYVNPFIDIDRTYAPVDLPDNLEVEGYQMEQTVKIVKREVESI